MIDREQVQAAKKTCRFDDVVSEMLEIAKYRVPDQKYSSMKNFVENEVNPMVYDLLEGMNAEEFSKKYATRSQPGASSGVPTQVWGFARDFALELYREDSVLKERARSRKFANTLTNMLRNIFRR